MCLIDYFKNSIRHNLSLHNRFIRVQNESSGKSSWWMINPDISKYTLNTSMTSLTPPQQSITGESTSSSSTAGYLMGDSSGETNENSFQLYHYNQQQNFNIIIQLKFIIKIND